MTKEEQEKIGLIILDTLEEYLHEVRDGHKSYEVIEERDFDNIADDLINKLFIHRVRLCFPTDDEIEDIADNTIPNYELEYDTSYLERRGFMDGAKWMREMIKNTDKWK